jgi:hypothetical protein
MKPRFWGPTTYPSDGIAKALRAAEAMANYAKEAGAAEFYGHTTVMDIEVVNGQVQAVVTDKGRIETDKVLGLCRHLGAAHRPHGGGSHSPHPRAAPVCKNRPDSRTGRR